MKHVKAVDQAEQFLFPSVLDFVLCARIEFVTKTGISQTTCELQVVRKWQIVLLTSDRNCPQKSSILDGTSEW